MQFKDYYEVLGVKRDASAEDIKKAFRRMARKYHPDVSKLPDASSRMSEINEAHAVLSDPERRAAYDAVGQGRQQGEAFTPPPDWDAGFEFSGGGGGEAGDFSDFFSELFGRSGARGQPRGTARQMRGEDHHAKVLLDLQDAWGGAVKQVSLRSPQLGADGRVTLATRTLDVKIPAGVKPGQLIRLAGQGGAGQAGAPAGDLFLEVQFHPHPQFRVDGVDLIAELPVAPWEAALGAVVSVPLPDGTPLKVRVPAGAQSGRRLTVRGKGLPTATPGDLELVVRVLLPSALDPRAKALYEQMARELPEFDARAQALAEGAAS
jgi:curved DNA-binding protein